MRRILLSGLFLLQTQLLGAQQIQRAFESWDDHVATTLTSVPMRSATPQREAVEVSRGDYRYEGLLVGGLAFGALGAWVGSQLREACPTEPGVKCGHDGLGDAVTLGLASAVLGGGLGYLIGRLSAKPPFPADSTRP
jgi:hypothetical protein